MSARADPWPPSLAVGMLGGPERAEEIRQLAIEAQGMRGAVLVRLDPDTARALAELACWIYARLEEEL